MLSPDGSEEAVGDGRESVLGRRKLRGVERRRHSCAEIEAEDRNPIAAPRLRGAIDARIVEKAKNLRLFQDGSLGRTVSTVSLSANAI